MLVLSNFLKIYMIPAKTVHEACRTHTTLYTKPIREILNFHYLPKLNIGFNNCFLFFMFIFQPSILM